ncbi:transglutaminase domain-containing protein [Winogradskyella litorisediminis]|uniref:Transglutaminase domain-containing protein n=1 Tax=Winogradskyella litorisediminis TaxID=1156618 RepID=A0ABW3N7K3_9FLAO
MAKWLKFFAISLFFSSISHTQSWDFNDVSFTEADRRAAVNKGESLEDMPQLVYALTNGLETDVEKFRAIYVWVCKNIKNDYGLYAKNKQKRNKFSEDSIKLEAWNEKFKKKIFKTLRKRRRTICTGYAYTIKVMSQLADIECEIVNGFAKTSSGNPDDLKYPNHSWNVVKLNNKWYLCDPTWSSGIQDLETGRFKFSYNNGLFLASPELFAINHFPLEQRWFLTEDIPTFNNFLDAPIVYNDAYKVLEDINSPTRLYNEIIQEYSLNISLRLKPKISYKTVTFKIDDGSNVKTRLPDSVKQFDNNLNISYQFTRRGFYDVHLYIDDFLVSTYVVRVKKEGVLD